MLGNVEKYLLTPIVLRFAKKYIKDAEGAAASDLSVSVSGGSVVFRNFELNLEGIVQHLPCSVVRAFARELQIKIPWTQLSTKPVEVLIDTVECIFKEGTPGGTSVVSTSSSDDDDSDEEDSRSQGLEDDEEAGPGWMGSLLKRTVANVTVHINNMVCKYLLPGGVISLSCKSVLIHSVGQDLQPGAMVRLHRTAPPPRSPFFYQGSSSCCMAVLPKHPIVAGVISGSGGTVKGVRGLKEKEDLEGGVCKAMVVTDITVCLDEITPGGTVAGYREPLVRTGACNADVSFTQASGRLNAVLEPLQVNVTNKQLQQLQMLIQQLRSASEMGMAGVDGEQSVESETNSKAGFKTRDAISDMHADVVPEDGRHVGAETAAQRRGAVGHIASAGKRAVSWAWNFLADEDSAGGGRTETAIRKSSMKEVEGQSGTVDLDSGLDFFVNLKLKQGSLSCFSETSLGRDYGNAPVYVEQTPIHKAPCVDGMTPMSYKNMKSEQGQEINGDDSVFLPTPSLFSELAKEMSPSRVRTFSCTHLSSLTWTNLEGDVHATKDRVHSGSLRLTSLMVEAHTRGSSTQQILRISPPPASAGSTEKEVDRSREGWEAVHENDVRENAKPHTDNGDGEEDSGKAVKKLLARLSEGIEFGWWQEEAHQGDSVHGILDAGPGMVYRNGSKSTRRLNQVEGQGLVCAMGDVYLTYHPDFIASMVTFLGLEASGAAETEAARVARKDCVPMEEKLSEGGPARPLSVLSLVRCAAFRFGVRSLTVAIESVSTKPSLSAAVVLKAGELRWWLVPKSAARPPALRATLTNVEVGVGRGWKGNETQLVRILNPTTCRVRVSEELEGKQGLSQAVASLIVSDLTLKVEEEECRSVVLVMQTLWGSRTRVHLPSTGTLPGTWIDLKVVRLHTDLLVCEGQLLGLQILTAVTLHHCTLQILGFRLECSRTSGGSAGLMYSSSPDSGAPDMSSGSEGSLEVGVLNCEIEVASFTALMELYKANTHLHSHYAARYISEERLQSVGEVENPSISVSVSMSIGLTSLVLIASCVGGVCSASQVAIREVHGAYKSGGRKGMGGASVRTGAVEMVVGGWVPVARMASEALPKLVPLDGPVLRITEWSGDVRTGAGVKKEVNTHVGEVNAFLSRAQHVLLLRHLQEVFTGATGISRSGRSSSGSSSGSSCGVGKDIQRQSCGPPAALVWARVRIRVSRMRWQADLWQDRYPEDQTTVSRLSVELEAIEFDRKEVGPQASLVGMSCCTHQLSVDSMEVLTCRRVERPGRDGADEAWNTHAVIGSLPGASPVDPLFLAQWQTKGVERCQVAVEVKPMEWRMDAQLLEELVTVAWERRKNLPRTPGADVMPFTASARIVTRLLRLHVFASFPTPSPPAVAVDRGAGVVVEVEQSVALLYSGVEGDVRTWTGIHVGGGEGVMDMGGLRVQGFEVSVRGCESRLEGGSGGPSIPLHPHCDMQAVGKLMGCPGPIFLDLHIQHLRLHLCPQALNLGLSVVRGLSDAWGATWLLRQQCAGPPTPCDDLRSGAFCVAPVMSVHQIQRGQMGWGDGSVAEGVEAKGGWLAWRYWFPHAVERVVIGPPCFEQLPAAGASIRLCLWHWDVAADAFVEAASVMVTGRPGASAEMVVAPPVSAEKWQLSWQVGHNLEVLPATALLQSMQVNPRKSAGEGIMPFLALSLSAHQMQVAIAQQQGGGTVGAAEVGTLTVDKAEVGVHFWGSASWGISVGGVVSMEYLDLATYTHELLVDPCNIHMAVELSPGGHTSLADCVPRHYRAAALQPPPQGPGCVLSIHAPDSVTLRLNRSGVQESRRLLGGSSKEGSVGAFVVHNRISISVAYGQVGGGDVVLLPPGSSQPYSWRASPSLYPTAPRLLHVGIPFNEGGEGGFVGQWCAAVDIEAEGAHHRGLGVGTLGAIEVVICVQRQADATYSVTVGAAYRLVNHTARRLSLQFKGHLPSTFLKDLPGSNAGGGGAYEGLVESEESEVTVVLEPQAGEDLLFMRIERGVEVEREEAVGQLRVLFTPTERWSEWADLAEEVAASVSASCQLLSLEGVVEEAESEESVTMSFPCLWLQTCTPSVATCDQVTIAFWPLYSLYNALCVPVEVCLISDQKAATESRVEVEAEVSLDVAQCGGQAVSFKLGVEQGGGSIGESGGALWSAPLQFAPDAVDKEGSFVPRMGQHCSLRLPHGDGKAFSCALVAKDHPAASASAVPTISLALLPYALLHNQLPVPVAVAEATDASLTAWAGPLTQVPFSWRRAPARKARLGLSLGLDLGLGGEAGWSWSPGVAVDVEGISEVGVVAEGKEGPVEYRFLIRVTLFSEEEVEEKWRGNGYQCCHLCVYPATLLSNLSPRNLVVEVGHATGSAAHPTLLPLAGGAEMVPLLAFPWRQDGTCGAAEAATPGGSGSSSRGGSGGGVEGFVARLADGGSEEWSHPLRLRGCVVNQQLLLPASHGGTHTALLTCTTLVLHRQLHLLVRTDPQPQCLIRNDTDHTIEVAGAGADGLCARVAAHCQLDFGCDSMAGVGVHPTEAGSGSGGEGGQDLAGGLESSYEELLDEALLVHLKKGPEAPSLLLRPTSHHWSDPLVLLPGNSIIKTITCAPVEGSESQEVAVLRVRIASLGPTVVVAVGGPEDSKGVEEDVFGTSFAPALSVRVDVKEVRLSMWEDVLLRGMGVGQPVCDEVGVVSLEGVSVVVQRGEEQSCCPFLPPVERYRVSASLRTLRAHSYLPHAEVPLVLTSQLDPTSKPPEAALQVCLEVCRAAAEHGWWVRTADISSCPLLVNVDDSLLAAMCRLLQIPGPNGVNGAGSATTSPPLPVMKGVQALFRAAGRAPERHKELCIAERNTFVECLSVGCVRLVVSVHVTWPWVVDTNRSPLRFSPLHSRRLLFPPLLLLRGLLAHYVTEGILNTPQIVGSLDLIFNPTGLVRSVQAGLRDLVALPLAHGFLYGLGLGGMSLIRHVSTWTLTSIAGFSSSLARLLERVYVEGGNPKSAPGLAGVGEGFARGLAQLFLSPVRGAARGGGSGLLLGVGKVGVSGGASRRGQGGGSERTGVVVAVLQGLAGAIAAPLTSALHLLALTSNGLAGSQSSALTRGVSSTGQRHTSRTSVFRFERQILAGTAERYLAHAEVLAGVLTTTANEDPRILQCPLLLLTHLSLHAMEYGGVVMAASLALDTLEVSEDPTDLSLTLFSGSQHGGSLKGRGEGKGLQLYVRFGERGWAVWVPKLRRAIAQKHRTSS